MLAYFELFSSFVVPDFWSFFGLLQMPCLVSVYIDVGFLFQGPY